MALIESRQIDAATTATKIQLGLAGQACAKEFNCMRNLETYLYKYTTAYGTGPGVGFAFAYAWTIKCDLHWVHQEQNRQNEGT